MSTLAQRLPVFVLVGLMLMMIGSGLGGQTYALQSTPDPAATETAVPTDTGLTETPAAPDAGGALPAERPVIVGSLNGIPVEGIPGSFCWPQADTTTPQCNFVDDPQPTTPINVVNGDAIVFSTEPVSPAPTTFIGILLDDRNADGEPQEINLSNLGGIFTVDNLSDGQHRLQVDALYPGDEQNQPFVSYVYLLSVGGAAPTELPTETPVDVIETPVDVTPAETESPTPDGGVIPEATETPTPGDVLVDVTPTETALDATPLDITPTETPVDATPIDITPTETALDATPLDVTPTETPADATPVDITPTEVTPVETATETPTETPTATVADATAVPPTETTVPTLPPTFTPSPVAPVQVTTAPQTTPITASGTAINVTVPIPQARIIVGGRTYEPVAINACAGTAATEYICITQPLNVSVPRVYAAPGDAAQVTFSGSRPTGITLSVLSSDGSRVIGTAQIRPDNLILYNLPAVVGNYVISVEFVYPEGKATYFFRLGIGT